MPRKDKVTRSLSIAAIVVSGLSLVASIAIPIVGFRLAYSERIYFELLGDDLDYIHVLSLHSEKTAEPSVTRIAVWQKMRVANNSGKPVSVVSIFYREDDAVTHDPVLPLFGKVQYGATSASCEDPMELPIYLDPGQVVVFYALLPVSVHEDLGRPLYKVFRNNPPSHDALIWSPFTFGQAFFDKLYTEDSSFVDNLISKKGARIDRLTYQTIDVTRTLFSLHDGEYSFLDQNNDAVDGISYKKGGRTFSQVYDRLRADSPSTGRMPDLPFVLYNIYLQTNSGNVYHEWLSPSSLPFQKYLARP